MEKKVLTVSGKFSLPYLGKNILPFTIEITSLLLRHNYDK